MAKPAPVVVPTTAAAPAPSGGAPPNMIRQLSGFVFGPTEDINKDYTLGKTYGESKFGKAVQGTDKKTKQDFAVKIITKAKYDASPLHHSLHPSATHRPVIVFNPLQILSRLFGPVSSGGGGMSHTLYDGACIDCSI